MFSSLYSNERIFGLLVFLVVGGQVAVTSYMVVFVEELQSGGSHGRGHYFLDSSGSSKGGMYGLAALWAAITVGRVVGLWRQVRVFQDRSLPSSRRFDATRLLLFDLYLFLAIGALGAVFLLVASFGGQGRLAWAGILLYGFGNGPTIGYLYDLAHRTTVTSEKGTSIIMLGLNLGASIVPWGTAELWEATGAPSTLMVTALLCMVLPIPILLYARNRGDCTIGDGDGDAPIAAAIAAERASSVNLQLLSSGPLEPLGVDVMGEEETHSMQMMPPPMRRHQATTSPEVTGEEEKMTLPLAEIQIQAAATPHGDYQFLEGNTHGEERLEDATPMAYSSDSNRTTATTNTRDSSVREAQSHRRSRVCAFGLLCAAGLVHMVLFCGLLQRLLSSRGHGKRPADATDRAVAPLVIIARCVGGRVIGQRLFREGH